jgi:hypothetical protein
LCIMMKSLYTSMYRNVIVFMENAVRVDEISKYLYDKKTKQEPIPLFTTLFRDMRKELKPQISKNWSNEAFWKLNKEGRLKYFTGCFPSVLSQ